jgi:hypothetical protein
MIKLEHAPIFSYRINFTLSVNNWKPDFPDLRFSAVLDQPAGTEDGVTHRLQRAAPAPLRYTGGPGL